MQYLRAWVFYDHYHNEKKNDSLCDLFVLTLETGRSHTFEWLLLQLKLREEKYQCRSRVPWHSKQSSYHERICFFDSQQNLIASYKLTVLLLSRPSPFFLSMPEISACVPLNHSLLKRLIVSVQSLSNATFSLRKNEPTILLFETGLGVYNGIHSKYLVSCLQSSRLRPYPIMMDERDTQDMPAMENSTPDWEGEGQSTIIINAMDDDGEREEQSTIVINVMDDDESKPLCQSFPCNDCVVENRFWNLQTMNCYNDFYQYPHVVSASGNIATYQCCSVLPENGHGSSFLVSSPAYQATVWNQFVIASIAASMAFLLIASIGRSLYLATKKNTTSSQDASRQPNNTDYSAYNMYLLFLAIPGLAYNLFMLGIVTPDFFNGWIPENDALITISATTTQYMNAIIAREVLVLLRNSKDGRQYSPPSFWKAVVQFTGVTLYASILGVSWMYLLNYSSSTNGARATKAIPAEKFSISVYFLLVIILPGIYLLWVCFDVWHKQLLTKENNTTVEPKRHLSIDGSRSTARCTDEMSHPSSLKSLFEFSFRNTGSNRLQNGDFRDNTNDTRNTNKSLSSKLAFSNTTSNTTSTDGSVLNSMAKSLQENALRDSIPPLATTLVSSDENLKSMATHFFRIILIFFVLWVPGMILYYRGYQTDRNASSILHNIGLMMFSLHAIVSNLTALSKPDVKRSTQDLYEEIKILFFRYCLCCRKSRDEGSDWSATSKAVLSTGKYIREESHERDIETATDEEPSQRFSRDGIQVSQFTTQSISSFNSSSHPPKDIDNEIDIENSEYLEFATAGPRVSRSSRVVVPGTSGHARGIKIDESEKTEPKRTSVEKPSSDSSSSQRKEKRKSLKAGRRGSGILSPSASTSKKKATRRTSTSQSSRKSLEANIRKNFKGKQSSRGSGRRRNSTSSIPSPNSPVGKWQNVISSLDVDLGQSPKLRRGSDSLLEQKQSDTNIQNRRNSAIEDDSAFSELMKLLEQRRGSASDNVQKRRNSAVGDSPVSELRKMFDQDGNQKGISPGARPANRRGSGSHLCKLNASNSPVAQMALNLNNTSNPLPAVRRMPRRSSDTKVDISKSPVAQLRKKFTINDNDFSKSSIPSPPTKVNPTDIDVSKSSPVAEMRKKFERGNDQLSAPRLEPSKHRNSVSNSTRATKSPSRRRLSNSDKNIGDSPNRKPTRRGSGIANKQSPRTFRGDSTSTRGRTKRISTSKSLSFDGRVTDNFLSNSS